MLQNIEHPRKKGVVQEYGKLKFYFFHGCDCMQSDCGLPLPPGTTSRGLRTARVGLTLTENSQEKNARHNLHSAIACWPGGSLQFNSQTCDFAAAPAGCNVRQLRRVNPYVCMYANVCMHVCIGMCMCMVLCVYLSKDLLRTHSA